MSVHSHIFKTAAVLATVLAGGIVLADENRTPVGENPFGSPSTNAFSTNTVRKTRALDGLSDKPREFGVFSPLHTPVPASFGNSQASPVPVVPQVVPQPPRENVEDKGKGWIFNKPEDNLSAEKIFKVKNFGIKDNEKEKKQSAFAKYIAEETKKQEKETKTADEARRSNQNDSDKSDKSDNRGANTSQERQERFERSPQSDTYRDFTARNPALRVAETDRAKDATPRTSVFGEFFRGNHVAEERWAQQAAARRGEFEQLFEARDSIGSKSLVSVTPTTVVAPTDYSKPANTGSDPWKNDSRTFTGPRSAFEDGNSRALGTGTTPGAISTPATTRPQYQPAVLPFPKRPGELFK